MKPCAGAMPGGGDQRVPPGRGMHYADILDGIQEGHRRLCGQHHAGRYHYPGKRKQLYDLTCARQQEARSGLNGIRGTAAGSSRRAAQIVMYTDRMQNMAGTPRMWRRRPLLTRPCAKSATARISSQQGRPAGRALPLISYWQRRTPGGHRHGR